MSAGADAGTGDANAGGEFQAGRRVRLKSDPARIGILTGATESRKGSTRWQVEFLDGSGAEFVPELALEAVTAASSNTYELVRNGRFARLVDLRGSLTYFRLSGRLADLVYSLNTTNTDFYAYQFKPVLSFLDSPCRGILIADEVGLGKTIEAGLIWTELRSRDDANRLLVLCPAMLRLKWQRELSEKRSGSRRSYARCRDPGAAPGDGGRRRPGFAVIASLQGLRPIRRMARGRRAGLGACCGTRVRFLFSRENEDPLIDLTIVDEAHYLRNPETQTARLGNLLRPVTENPRTAVRDPGADAKCGPLHLLHLLTETRSGTRPPSIRGSR
ncbi:MAG: SNF2-related protein [Steroidobacteraceae bacterium]